MILNDREIREAIEHDDLITIPNYPYELYPEMYEPSIQPASYDLTLGKSFKRMKKIDGCIEFGIPIEYEEVPYEDGVIIQPGEFMLAITNEIVTLPSDIGAFIATRSSFGRIGLSLAFGAWVDPGYVGALSIQVYNSGPAPVKMVAGKRSVQLVFMRLEHAAEMPYHGKYQHSFESVDSKLYKDIIQ